MNGLFADIIVIVILALIVGGALLYIRKNKKNGIKCIGCPYAKSCTGGCSQTPADHTKGGGMKS